ncbi:hypothetical protein PIB30_015295 [Stylosanthes scabra]|uniref:DUF7731 domain-containing protein n=1 Tax=Stylosanthes scabra TaxID=79078 RepID=A0ABU6Z5H4_9FABA|nr:hypothetical protein [Stylosanthes scabra]
MEHGKSKFLLFFSLATCFVFLLCPTYAENKINPRANVNLSPFESWRSAYFCIMNNYSKDCAPHNTLTFSGKLYVSQDEIGNYCDGGCKDHTLALLKCAHEVKRKGFLFENGASLLYVYNKIDAACNQHSALNTSYTKPNSATSLYGRYYMPLVSALTTIALLSTFSM